MKTHNEQILAKLQEMRETWGDNAQNAINQIVGFYHVYGNSKKFEILLNDRFVVVTPIGAKEPMHEIELAIDMSTGTILIDSNGLFLEHKRSVADALMTARTGLVRGDYDQDLARARETAKVWN